MMKEDILKFRKLCDTLIKEKDYTVNLIVIESGITWPTMKIIREKPIDEIRIQASIKGRIQDFIRKHCEDIGYLREDATAAGTKIHEEIEAGLLKGQPDIMIAKERDLGPATKAEKASMVGAAVHEKLHKEILGKRKYTKKEKPGWHLTKDAEEHIKSGKSTIPDYLFEEKKDPEVIEPRSLVQIIVFLRMEATRYRELARNFEVSAEQLAKVNTK